MSLRIPYFRKCEKNTAKERHSTSKRHKKTKKHLTLPEGATPTTQHTTRLFQFLRYVVGLSSLGKVKKLWFPPRLGRGKEVVFLLRFSPPFQRRKFWTSYCSTRFNYSSFYGSLAMPRLWRSHNLRLLPCSQSRPRLLDVPPSSTQDLSSTQLSICI